MVFKLPLSFPSFNRKYCILHSFAWLPHQATSDRVPIIQHMQMARKLGLAINEQNGQV